MLNYDHEPSKAYVESIGLVWDEDFAKRFDRVADEEKLTQNTFDIFVQEHAWRVRCLFDPSLYSVWQRILFALYFLNPFPRRFRK